MAALEHLQHELENRLRSGESWSRIEHELIEPCELAEDDKSALWLYGWSFQEDGPLRREHPRELSLV